MKNSNSAFSNIGVDQAHKQNNKLIKIDGGAIEILESPNSLLRWFVAEPIVVQICKTIHAHHEGT